MVNEKNQFLKDYKTALIFGIGGLVIGLILIGAAGLPAYNGMVKTTRELKAKKLEQSQMEAKLENLKKLSEKEADLKSQNEKVLSALPEDKGVSRLFVQFENIAKQNGIDITSVAEAADTTATATPAGGLSPVSYNVTGTAKNYASIKSALAKIETALRVLSVGKIDASSTGGSLNTTFTVTTYVRGTQK